MAIPLSDRTRSRAVRRGLLLLLLVLLLIGGAIVATWVLGSWDAADVAPNDRDGAAVVEDGVGRDTARRPRDRVRAGAEDDGSGTPDPDAPIVVTTTTSTTGGGATGAGSPRVAAPASAAANGDSPVSVVREVPAGLAEDGLLRVTVTDGASGPRTGVHVRAVAIRGGPVETVLDADVDAAGQAASGAISPGNVTVSVRAGDLTRRLPAKIEAGLVTDVTVDLPRGARVSGTVSHIDSGPLARVTVKPAGASRWRATEGTHVDEFSTSTDESGRYVLEEVPAGTHSLSVTGQSVGYHPRARAVLEVPGSGELVHDIVLGEPSLEGEVVDSVTRTPIAGASIRIQDPLYVSVTTDVRGRYVFNDLPPGDMQMVASCDGYGLIFLRTGEIRPGAILRRDIELERAAVMVLTLVDENGSPVTGEVIVSLRPDVDGTGTRVSTNLTTDGEGRLEYAKIVPAAYTIGLSARGRKPASVKTTIEPGRNLVDAVLPREDATEDAVLLSGRVVDDDTGAGVPGARVSFPGGGSEFAITAAGGAFEVRGRGRRPTRVHVSCDGWGFEAVNVPDEGDVELRVRRSAELVLNVRRPGGEVYVGGLSLGISARDDGGTKVGIGATADDRGVAVFRQIVPGRYTIRVRGGDVGRAEIEVDVQPGRNAFDVDLQ